MTPIHQELIETLQPQIQPVQPDDTMAEAGRKVLLDQLVKLLHYEEGSRRGENIEEVHDMRVATRRIRSTLRLLEDYYKPKTMRVYRRQLRKLARALGSVRDLDVLVADMQQFTDTLDEQHKGDIQAVIKKLNEERALARHDLIRVLDKADYRRFVHDFSDFVTHSSAGAKGNDGDIHPTQVRHILPALLYSHVGAVRAYNDVLAEADGATLHALRIEFKRLRYAVALFADLLGNSVKDFVKEVKAIQDHLGRMQDIVTAQGNLNPMVSQLTDGQAESLQLYLDHIEAESQELRQKVDELWTRFNAKTVQKQLATAVTAL
jgi:CHAD domain-containing protein